jgi:hypothetical protein
MDSEESPKPDPRLSRGGNFGKALKIALDLFDRPHLAIVAATVKRAEYTRSLCVKSGIQRGGTAIFTPAAARAGLRVEPHHIVVLDASVERARRMETQRIARDRVTECRVYEIKSWRKEPPI